MTIRNLEYLFKPRSIAVIGSGKQAGNSDAIVEFNLIEGGFKGPVMPVTPDHQSVSGVLAYKDIAGLPVAVSYTHLDVYKRQRSIRTTTFRCRTTGVATGCGPRC